VLLLLLPITCHLKGLSLPQLTAYFQAGTANITYPNLRLFPAAITSQAPLLLLLLSASSSCAIGWLSTAATHHLPPQGPHCCCLYPCLALAAVTLQAPLLLPLLLFTSILCAIGRLPTAAATHHLPPQRPHPS
jgi:hypothetical protein